MCKSIMKINVNQEQGEEAINNLIALTSCIETEEQQVSIINELEEQGIFN